MCSVFTLSLPVAGQVSFCAERFTTLGAFVRLHRSVEPLVFKEFKPILKAPTTQWTVVCDASSWVETFDRCFPGGQRCRGRPMSGATLPVFTSTHYFGRLHFTDLFVPLLMFGQTLGGDEALSTLLTLMRLIMIYLLMILQVTNS